MRNLSIPASSARMVLQHRAPPVTVDNKSYPLHLYPLAAASWTKALCLVLYAVSMGRQRTSQNKYPEVNIATGTAQRVQVPGDPDSWVLYINGVPSSSITVSDPLRLDFEYLDWMSRVISNQFETTHALRAVHIGAGACSLPRWLAASYPGSRQTAIDIDATLLKYVREWFDLPRSPELALRAGDGAHEITTFKPASVDVLVRDAFAGSVTPDSLITDEFFRACATALKPEGVFVLNIADNPQHSHLRTELKRLNSSFRHVGLIAEPGHIKGRRWGNVVAVAMHTPFNTVGIQKVLRRGPVQAAFLSGTSLGSFVGIGVHV